MVASDGSVENNAGNIPGTNVNSTLAPSGPVTMIQYENDKFDFGTVDEGEVVKHVFKFKNAGNEPLLITNAKGSCGCTVPTYPKEPIMPGESNVIEVRYDTQRVGAFTKTVTLTTNEASDTHTLTIKGDVKAPASQESVPAGNGGLNQN